MEVSVVNSDYETKTSSCALSEEVMKSFQSVLKQGIYKELHKRRLLTDTQLNTLFKS